MRRFARLLVRWWSWVDSLFSVPCDCSTYHFLPFAYHEESIFSPAYDHLRNKIGFLEEFHRRISRPVLPSDEVLGYLPTQAVAAYVANVMGLDGVIYASTQVGAEGSSQEQVDRKLCNIALFGQAAKVEGAELPPPAALEHTELQLLFPDLHVGDAQSVTATPADVSPKPGSEPAIPVRKTEAATLRSESQPRLVRVRSVTVEVLPLFAHLYPDGNVIIDDLEDHS